MDHKGEAVHLSLSDGRQAGRPENKPVQEDITYLRSQDVYEVEQPKRSGLVYNMAQRKVILCLLASSSH